MWWKKLIISIATLGLNLLIEQWGKNKNLKKSEKLSKEKKEFFNK